jgi:hypothetical protein
MCLYICTEAGQSNTACTNHNSRKECRVLLHFVLIFPEAQITPKILCLHKTYFLWFSSNILINSYIFMADTSRNISRVCNTKIHLYKNHSLTLTYMLMNILKLHACTQKWRVMFFKSFVRFFTVRMCILHNIHLLSRETVGQNKRSPLQRIGRNDTSWPYSHHYNIKRKRICFM